MCCTDLNPIHKTKRVSCVRFISVNAEIDHISKEKGQTIPSYFVVNRLQPNLKVHQMFLAALENHSRVYDIGILNSKLNLRTVYGMANLYGQGVYEHSDKKAITEIVNLVNEVQQLFEKI